MARISASWAAWSRLSSATALEHSSSSGKRIADTNRKAIRNQRVVRSGMHATALFRQRDPFSDGSGRHAASWVGANAGGREMGGAPGESEEMREENQPVPDAPFSRTFRCWSIRSRFGDVLGSVQTGSTGQGRFD